MADRKHTVSRRQILASGAVAAGVAAAAPALAGPSTLDAFARLSWADAVAAWPTAYGDLIAKYRLPYLAEVRRLTEKLAPLFESGKLHGHRENADADTEEEDERAIARLEDLCAEHFGVQVAKTYSDTSPRYVTGYVGDAATANVIVALSPSRSFWRNELEGGEDDWSHPALYAAACIGCDVLAVARVLGIHRAEPGEDPSEEAIAWAREWRRTQPA